MKHVQKGTLPQHGDYNDLVDQVAHGPHGANMGVFTAPGGTAIVGKRTRSIGLWQIHSAFTLVDPGTYSQGNGDVPYALAQPVWLDDGAAVNEYEVSTDSDTYEVLYAPCGFLNGSGLVVGHPPASVGQRVWAVQSTATGRWEVLSPGHDVARFELKTALSSPGSPQSATAYLLPWNGSAYAEDTDIEITVWDVLGTRRGRAKNGDPGSQGYAKWMPDAGRWEILEMQPHALVIAAQVNNASGIAATDATMAIDNVAVIQPTGALLLSTPSVADNLLAMPYADDARVICFWNEADDDWLAIGAIATTACA